jgi:hypothetical protein
LLLTPGSRGNGTCCSGTQSARCIQFNITLNPNVLAIELNISNPGPGGSTQYRINCGTTATLATPICIQNLQSFCLSYCKPGNDAANYTFSTIKKPSVSEDIETRPGCGTSQLESYLFAPGTVNWTSIPANATSLLSCTNCPNPVFTPPASGPLTIQYIATGSTSSGPCGVLTISDTLTV